MFKNLEKVFIVENTQTAFYTNNNWSRNMCSSERFRDFGEVRGLEFQFPMNLEELKFSEYLSNRCNMGRLVYQYQTDCRLQSKKRRIQGEHARQYVRSQTPLSPFLCYLQDSSTMECESNILCPPRSLKLSFVSLFSVYELNYFVLRFHLQSTPKSHQVKPNTPGFLTTTINSVSKMCRHIHIQHLDPKPLYPSNVITCKVIFEKCQTVRNGDPCGGSKVIEVLREPKECQWCIKDYKMPIMDTFPRALSGAPPHDMRNSLCHKKWK